MPRPMTAVLALLIVGCAPQAASPTVQTVCEDAATQQETAIAALAAKRNTPEATLRAEFVSACVSQLTADLQEIPADLAAILSEPSSDAGADR